MERLGTADLSALRDALHAVGAVADGGSTAAVTAMVLGQLRRLLDFDVATVERLVPGEPMRQEADPEWLVDEAHRQYFVDHLLDHPMIGHFARTGDTAAHRFGDLLTDHELHALPIYNELFTHIGIERQAGFPAAGAQPPLVGVTVTRASGSDFSDRDMAVLALLQPMVVAAFRRAADRAVLGTLRELPGGAATDVVLLDLDHWPVWASRGAVRAIGRAHGWDGEGPLPPRVRTWLDRVSASEAGLGPPPRLQAGLRLRFVPRRGDGFAALLVEAGPQPPDAGDLRAHGLSRREAEVMALVVRGLTTAEIGDELYVSVGTVRKHLERIYAKLGVHTRAQATAVVSSPPAP